MDVRRTFRVLLLVASVLGAGVRPAAAAVDVSGRWGVVIQSPYFPSGVQSEWDFEQTGMQLALTITFTDPFISGTEGPLDGTIDPDTGVFHVDLPDAQVPFGFPPCPDSRIDGTASPDGLAISGFYSSYFFGTTPTTFGCNQSGGPFTGARCPGADGCCAGSSCCGNGVLSAPEECDDGNGRNGDCCSSTCQFEPAGSPCDDGNVCTAESGCDGAGTCQRVNVSGPCGTTCLPGTCAGGQCVFGDPAPQGTPCNDGNACTAGDQCNGSGNCYATTTLTCGPCEVCNYLTGCESSQPLASCGADTSSSLALAVRSSGRSSVSWRRAGGSGSPGLVGDPTAATEYDVCVFGAEGLVFQATATPGGTCSGKPCWRATSGGFRYRDRTGASDGLRKMLLDQDGPSFDLGVSAKGPNVQLPPFPGNIGAPVVAELRARDPHGNQCWQSRFDEQAITRYARTLSAKH
jgi:cysteine-rich repeat protein